MKTTWLRILALALMSLGLMAVLAVYAPAPAAAQSEPAASAEQPPAQPDADEGKETAEEQKDPDGGFAAPTEADKPVDLPADLRGTADFDISFPIDI